MRESEGLVLVTGGTGALGHSLVERLLESNTSRVRVLALDEASPFPPSVEYLSGDVTDREAVLRAMSGVRTVFHLAGLLHVPDSSGRLQPEYDRINVGGTRLIVDAAHAVGAARVVLFSTIAVYGPNREERLDEESATYPDTAYAVSKLSAERIVLEGRNSAGHPFGTVLRLSAVYGPRVKGNYRHLFEAVRRRRLVRVGPGRNRRTLVFDEDAACAAVLAATHPRAPGQIYNVSDGQSYPLARVIDEMHRALGRNSPRWWLPITPVRGAVLGVERAFRALGREPPVSSSMLAKYLENVVVDGTRIQQDLGFVPRFSLEEGWRTTVRRLRESGEIRE